MKILIVSDTHHHDENFLRVMELVSPVDMVIHCGDVEGSEFMMRDGAGCPVEMVTGNNDFFSNLPREREFMLGKYKVWLTHGHTYYVSMDTEFIKEEGRARGVDIIMFGHTHKPSIEIEKDIIAINPGSLTYPRQDGRKPSYIMMDLDREGNAHFTVRYL